MTHIHVVEALGSPNAVSNGCSNVVHEMRSIRNASQYRRYGDLLGAIAGMMFWFSRLARVSVSCYRNEKHGILEGRCC